MIDLLGGHGSISLEAVTLDLDEMQFLQQHLELDQLPTVLIAFARYDLADDQHAAFERARASLSERGLLDGDTVAPDLEDRLRALTRPHWVISLRLNVENYLNRLCLAKGDNIYTLVLRGPESYTVSEISEIDLAGSLIAALGSYEPLKFGGVNAPTEQLSEIVNLAGNVSAVTDQLTKLNVPHAEAETVARAITHFLARTQIVGVIYGDGKQEVAPGNIAVWDTANGRILATTTEAHDGAKWSSLKPGTPAHLRAAFNELITSLPDREEFRILPEQS